MISGYEWKSEEDIESIPYDGCKICGDYKTSIFDCGDCLEANGCNRWDVQHISMEHTTFPENGDHCWCKKPCFIPIS